MNDTIRKLTITYTLGSANPNKLYEVGISAFCTTFPTTFGQFPTNYAPGGNCDQFTRQGVTKTFALMEFGVVTTDMNGDGSSGDFQSPGPTFGDATTITIP